jgi:hypothetical protein
LPAAAQVPSYVPTDGLVGWWPFNGNANDESGNGNDGVVNGATLSSDRNDSGDAAYSFSDQSIQYIEVANSTSLNNIQSLTISLWCNLLSHTDYNHYVNKSDQNPVTQSGNYQFVFANSETGVYFYYNDWPNVFQTNYLPELNQWTHLVITYEYGNLNTCNFYANSNLIDSFTTTGPLPFTMEDIQIGGYSTENYNTTNGKLDDIAIYNRALTEQEIQNLYTGTTPPPCVSLPSNLQQGLVGYWPFCGNANDESGNGNDGVVNGATLTEDRFGNANAAYGFDGVDDYIQTTYLGIPLNDSRTISFWARTNGSLNLIDDNMNAVCYGGPGNGATYEVALNHVCDGLSLDINNGVNTMAAITNNNTWSHYTVVFDNGLDNSFSAVTYYQNSQLLSSICQDGGGQDIVTATLNPVVFGSYWNHLIRFFSGSLDDIAIWNRALTPEEVQELYTLDACTFTVYDTVTVYETVYDTMYTYETIYDTVTTYVTVTDTLLIDITLTAIEGQPGSLNTVTVYPNPASDHITIDYGNYALMAGYNTIITDAAGATVYSSAVNSQQVEIDINAWGAMGVYYMSLYDASGQLVAVRHIVLE